MNEEIKNRLQKDIDYGNEMQSYWNKYRKDFLVFLAGLIIGICIFEIMM